MNNLRNFFNKNFFIKTMDSFNQVKKFSSTNIQNESHFNGTDLHQSKIMKEEMCILVNEQDKVIGKASKEDSHLMKNIDKGMLHRAFSVILFNSKNECLLTQRSSTKITFPNYFTNSCCSHPLYNQLELDEKDAIGIKRAAQRRLRAELGIKETEVTLEDFVYLTKLYYKAPSDGSIWGEHEIDYILIVKKDVNLKPDPNEVQYFEYLNKEEFKKKIEKAQQDNLVTPWFVGIHEKFLYTWWDNIDKLDKFKDIESIHRL